MRYEVDERGLSESYSVRCLLAAPPPIPTQSMEGMRCERVLLSDWCVGITERRGTPTLVNSEAPLPPPASAGGVSPTTDPPYDRFPLRRVPPTKPTGSPGTERECTNDRDCVEERGLPVWRTWDRATVTLCKKA